MKQRPHYIILLLLLLPLSVAAKTPEQRFIDDIKEKYRSLETYECEFEEFNPTDTSWRRDKGKIFGQGLKKFRVEELYASGHKNISISDGNYLWTHRTYENKVKKKLAKKWSFGINRPVFFDFKGHYPINIYLRSTEELDGVPCTVLQAGQHLLWIDQKTGLVLKKETYSHEQKVLPAAGAKPFKVEVYSNCKVNHTLQESLFAPIMPPGTTIEEVWFEGGEKKTRKTKIPFKEIQQSDETVALIAKLKEQFESLKDISLKYKHVHNPDHQTTDKDGKLVTPTETCDAILKVGQGGKMYFDYTTDHFNYTRSGTYATDGITIWSQAPAGKGGSPYVTKQTKGLFENMLESITKKFDKPAHIRPLPLKNRTPSADQVPEFFVDIYKFLKPGNTMLKGTETVSGTECYHFESKLSPDNLRTEVWIGKADGVPRKIVEYVWRTDSVKTTYSFSEVEPNTGLTDDAFKIETSSPVLDMDARLPEMKEMFQNTFDTPPKTIFEGLFSTPANKVTELRGTGTVWFTYHFHIRFKAGAQPDFKEEQKVKLKPTTAGNRAEVVDFFKSSFPKDAQTLDSPDLVIKDHHKDKDHIWLAHDPKTQLWFIRAWGDE